MAILTPSQLVSASNATYFDNTSGSITPGSVRTLNTDWISSSILVDQTGSMSVASASVATSANTSVSSSYSATASVLLGAVVSASFAVTASYALNVPTASVSASYALTASFALTASSADQFNVRTALTASGLIYPTADGTVEQFLSTNGAGTLSFANVRTLYQNIRNRESVTINKGTPLFVSGSTGDNADVYLADASNPARMPATLIAGDTTLAASAVGRGIILGHIEGVDTTGYPAGTEVFVAGGGGWTSIRPTGSAEVQSLGVVTREGSNGMGIVLTVPPAILPNVAQGYTWVGNASGVPVAVATSSLSVLSSSYANNANLLDGLDSTVFVQTGSYNTFSGSIAGRVTNLESASGSYATLAGNNTFTGTNIFNGPVTASNVLMTSASIQNLTVVYETASVIYSSGSNQFGDAANDVQTLFGTVDIKTGPLQVTGSTSLSGSVNIDNGTVQILGPGTPVGLNYVAGTDIIVEIVGQDISEYEAYANATGDAFNVHVDANGTELRDLNGGSLLYNTWLTVPSNVPGGNPAPIMSRGLTVSGSTKLSGSITTNGSTVMQQANGFPLLVSGTLQTQRIHFNGNPFNGVTGSNLGAIRFEGNNQTFYSTNYDLTNISTGSTVGQTVITASGQVATYLQSSNYGNDYTLTLNNIYGTGSLVSTAPLVVTGSITSTQNITAPNFIGTASFGATASYLNPLNQNVEITGSLSASANIVAGGNVSAFLVDTNYIRNNAGPGGELFINSPDSKLSLSTIGSSGITKPILLVASEIRTTGSFYISGSVNAPQGFTGSLLGTASLAATASSVNTLNQNVVITGSLNMTGSLNTVGTNLMIAENSSDTALHVSGTLQTERIQFISNPFNFQPSSYLGAIRFTDSNQDFTLSNYNIGLTPQAFTTQSLMGMYVDTGSNYVNSYLRSVSAGVSGTLDLSNANGNIRLTTNAAFNVSASNAIFQAPGGAGVGTWFQNRVLISGPSAGETPTLWVSGSDGAYTQISRGSNNINTTIATAIDASGQIYANDTRTAGQYIGVYTPDTFVDDVEHAIIVTNAGVTFNDWDNGSAFDYIPYMTIAPNLGDNPAPQFKRNISVTGSVAITEVLNLKAQNPLPGGTVGDLAVSGSSLYFYNGAWTLVV